MIEAWAKAIQKHEGYFPGSRSYRNNNPGNLRYTSYTNSLGANKGQDDNRFVIYKTFDIGFGALKQFITDAANGELRAYRPEMTLVEFYSVYAPSGDGNYPLGYATAVAKDLGVKTSTKIKDLLDTAPKPVPPVSNSAFQVLSQRDPRWAKEKIGKTQVLVGDKGCTLTCVAMSSSWFGDFRDPKDVAKNLKYTKDALLIWSSIGELFSKFEFEWRFYFYDVVRIDEALKNPNKTVLLQVDNHKHWVHAIRRIPMTKTFLVADPWDGKRKLYSGVVGGTILVRK